MLRVRAKLSMDARPLKTLISYLRARINLIQYFRSIFHFYLKTMHILQTKNYSEEIN